MISCLKSLILKLRKTFILEINDLLKESFDSHFSLEEMK